MEEDDITKLISGITMDGTEFDFDTLCSSIVSTIITKMIFEWIMHQIKEKFPEELHNNPEIYSMVFEKYKLEITESIERRYDEIHKAVEDALRKEFAKTSAERN